MKIMLSWKQRSGGCVTEITGESALEPRIQVLFHRRLAAEAWVDGHRDFVVGEVLKRDGRWLWWVDSTCNSTSARSAQSTGVPLEGRESQGGGGGVALRSSEQSGQSAANQTPSSRRSGGFP